MLYNARNTGQYCRYLRTAGAIGFYTSGQLFLAEYYTLGVIGKAGLGTPQMDGNTRLWNIDPMMIPHWSPPTHSLQIWRYAEQGSIEMLWISGTNPLSLRLLGLGTTVI
jgi:hypothetical protein